jgi:membrane protein YdbS with pleckstrin-like domain
MWNPCIIRYQKENEMKLTPPKAVTFWIAIVLGLLGLLGNVGVLGAMVGGYAFWLAFAGFALLALGLLVKGL